MNDNIFEKIDKQSQTLSEVADKLDGISVEDLYALAKRTWDYKDYVMAQKYYNHISLLRPLDWKAPFMASLCGCLEGADVTVWGQRPKAISRCYESTVAYIQNRDIDEEEKNKDILQVIDITFDIWREYIRLYLIPEHKTSFDRFCPNFKRELQKAFMAFIKSLDEYSTEFFREKQEEICKTLADFLSDHCSKDHSIAIEKEDLEKYVLPYNAILEYDENTEPVKEELTPEQEKEIKLKGKCYLVYKDKVLEKQARQWNIRMAVILVAAAICTTLFPLFQATYQWRSFLVLLLLPIIVVYCCKGFGNRKGIRSDSLLNINRWKYRSTSEGDVIQERRFSPLTLFVTLMPSVGGIPTIILIVLSWAGIKSPLSIVLAVLLTISYLIELFSICAVGGKKVFNYASNFVKRIEYQGKTHFFDE